MKNIVLIGSGNMATNLGLELVNHGYIINQVWSKNLNNAEILAKKLNSKSTDRLSCISKADLYIVAVKDDALKSILEQLNLTNIIHTSASTGLDIFNSKLKNYGVFYPLQTFNKKINLNFSNIPIFIEADNDAFCKILIKLANKLSNTVIKMNSEQRKTLHIAAVFACNFTNHMLSIADNILSTSNIDFKLLHPLINQSIKKISNNKPTNVQTGPAKRKDKKIIESHIQNIPDKKIKKLYQLISTSIIENNV